MELRPLSQGNRLQRAYARWAAPHYARMSPDLREQAEMLDRLLYSRRGLGIWLGLLGAIVGTVFGLTHTGMPVLMALLVSLLVWCGLPLSGLAAWLQPGKFSLQVLRRKLPHIALMALLGGLAGFVAGHVAKTGQLEWSRLLEDLWQSLRLLVPAALAGALAMLALIWGVARVRLQMMQRVLDRERLGRERDTAARQVAEAQLRLLQAQIEPHFIFNTLATVQHWVDTADPRAPELLRALTGFLRGSTELLGRASVSLGEELATVQHYLHIQRARLGDRLRCEVAIEDGCAQVQLPPGLVLTLVENAVEHGLAPALQGGTLRLGARAVGDALELRVCDDGVGLAPDWADGVGLRNSRERLRHLGNGQGTLVLTALQPGTEARLLLPGVLQGPWPVRIPASTTVPAAAAAGSNREATP